MHNCIISGASCYPCGAVVEKVEGTDEEFCRYLLCRRNFFPLFQTLLRVFSHILDTSAWIFPSPWNEPVFLCSLSCWSLKLFNSWVIAQLLSLFSVLPVSNPVPPLCCEIQNVNLSFTVYTEPFYRVWNRSIKAALLVLEQSPVSANTVLLATISKGLEKLYENGANRYFPTFWWVLAYRFLNLKFVFSNSC